MTFTGMSGSVCCVGSELEGLDGYDPSGWGEVFPKALIIGMRRACPIILGVISKQTFWSVAALSG